MTEENGGEQMVWLGFRFVESQVFAPVLDITV